MSNNLSRRRFLTKSVTASSTAAMMAISFEEKALLAHQAYPDNTSENQPAINGLPRGKIGNITISRIIGGHNLFGGGAHARNLKYVSALMRRYFTEEKRFDTLQLCEENGINTNIGHVELINKYNKERGGKMQILAMIDPDHWDWSDDKNPDGSITTTKAEIRESVVWAADRGSQGAFLLGSRGDRWVKAKRLDLIDEFVSLVKKNGMICGVGAHDIRVPIACEESNIDADFYFKTIHPETYWDVIPKDQRKPFHVDSFGPNDNDCMWELWPEETIKIMQSVKKPWIGFKVLAAGAIHPSEGFKFAFENGVDFVSPGMFDWQVRENVMIAKEVLASDEVKNLNFSNPSGEFSLSQ